MVRKTKTQNFILTSTSELRIKTTRLEEMEQKQGSPLIATHELQKTVEELKK